MSIQSDIEDVASSLRTLASQLRAGSRDPATVQAKLRRLASDLDDLATKLRRAFS